MLLRTLSASSVWSGPRACVREESAKEERCSSERHGCGYGRASQASRSSTRRRWASASVWTTLATSHGRNLFASSEGADEYGAQLTAEGVWLATQPGNVAAALDWLHEAIDSTNVLRQQLEAEADAVEKEIVEWERGREDAS